MLKTLDLFSGIGGFSLGLERTGGFKTVAFCEIDPYCRAILKKHWPDVPCDEDIGGFMPQYGEFDVITGGFPCQPFSHAGKRRGAADDRALWPQMCRIIARTRPTWVIGENVPGIISLELDTVLSDLETLGYSARTLVIPACAIGAPHRRDRVWIIAHAQRFEQPRQESRDGEAGRVGRFQQSVSWDRNWETALRGFRGMDDGLSYRVDRLDAIRNAIVPQIAEMIGRAILQHEGTNP